MSQYRRRWKAMRGTCPVCRRDVATSPEARGELVGEVHRVKKHRALLPGGRLGDDCPGRGRMILIEHLRPPAGDDAR